MAAKEKGLEDLFLATLKDVYYAEKQILRALPKMAKAAESDELRQAFEKHRAETEGHVERLEEVFEAIGKKAQGKTCEAIQGIIEEGKEIMEDFAESEALDAGLIAAAQAVEHYEISRYGTLRTWAQELGLTRCRRPPRTDPGGGEEDRPAALAARRGAGQPEGGLSRRRGAVSAGQALDTRPADAFYESARRRTLVMTGGRRERALILTREAGEGDHAKHGGGGKARTAFDAWSRMG